MVRYYGGLDYRVGDTFHGLADYNTGSDSFASVGFQYRFAARWDIKTGLEANHGGNSNFMIKIIYNGSY